MPVIIAGDVIVGETRRLADVWLRQPFASPKSSTLTVPSGRDLDVRRLQIAVDDPLLVRRFERFGDLPRDRQRLVERNRARAMRCDRSSPSTSSITSAVMPRLLRARRCRQCSGGSARRALPLRVETARADLVSGERGRQDLDRDLTFQLGVGRAIHLAHAAFADLGGDFVDAEARAGSESQIAVNYRGDTGDRGDSSCLTSQRRSWAQFGHNRAGIASSHAKPRITEFVQRLSTCVARSIFAGQRFFAPLLLPAK